MSKTTLENLFEELEGKLDLEEPKPDHKQRFLKKLNNTNNTKIVALSSNKKVNFWKPLIGVAAALALIFTLVLGNSSKNEIKDLANVSPEMAQTQDFFTLTIAEELNKLQQEKSPETQRLINDALNQIQALENEYGSLKLDLKDSGDDKRVIHAMISNFQTRIDILQNTIEQIETIKQLKNNYNENSNTI